MIRHDVTDDRQTESGPTRAAPPRLVDPVETLENSIEIRRRDADAFVIDRDDSANAEASAAKARLMDPPRQPARLPRRTIYKTRRPPQCFGVPA